MKILVTGARGFVGRNLVSQLYNIRDGKARNYSLSATGLEIFEYDVDTDPALLDEYCRQADFVFNLAGVNRPRDTSEFMKGGHVGVHERELRFCLHPAGDAEETW